MRLLPVQKLQQKVGLEFDLDESLRVAFNAYRQALGRSSGTLEQFQAAHMELLHRWLKQRVANPRATHAQTQIRNRMEQIKKEQEELRKQNSEIIREYRTQYMAPAADQARFEQNHKRIKAGYTELRELDDARTDLAEEDAKLISDIENLKRRKRYGQSLTFCQETMLRAWENDTPLPPDVARFFDLYTHDSVAHFDYDTSRLTDWRTIYFADDKYSPS